ncbi:MAG TPA: radical SAM protein [Terracidiphilus sp.]
MADLATVTVAAIAPPYWDVSVCDEFISQIDFDHPAAYIGITGKITQAPRMLEIAAQFRRRGKTVIIGGPYASLDPGVFRGHCDILLQGELEEIGAGFFRDLEQGIWKEEYFGEKADLSLSPLPRWDLYPTDRALSGTVQTSRGCPFECEFCDVIQYLGRKQRGKPTPQVTSELDMLYDRGFRTVFLADDNFTANRARARQLLSALRDWNRARPAGQVAFNTQLSIDAARDPELLRLLAEAGMRNVFVGIESPNQESLKECKKNQNVGVDLVAQARAFVNHGISVTGGMILGFDHDGPDIFERQFQFAMASPIPIFSVGALVAPAATPLLTRISAAGRLVSGGPEVAGSPWDTNIIPKLMTRSELLTGIRKLCYDLYHPENFARRVLNMIEAWPEEPSAADSRFAPRRIDLESMSVVRKVMQHGKEEKEVMGDLLHAVEKKPSARRPVQRTLFRYAQVRCMYEFQEAARLAS